MSIRYYLRILAILALAFFTFLMVRLSLPYTAMNSGVDFLVTKQRIYHISYWRVSFYTHVFTSCLVLIAGFTQFNPWLLRRYPRVHRRMGWVYLVTVVGVSGPAAFVMAWYANGGLPARTSFTLLSLLWMLFTFYAGWKVVKKDFSGHGAFMFRSYALTLSALTLRLYTYISAFLPLDASPREIYITTAWLSWVPNLIIAEMLIRRGWVEKIYRSPLNA
ncbi:MAG: hypothetical protein BGO55_27540 [Sphingobacteriales bacterium 50-39]|nr:DUF2306 domain-containing protein [Sphingobacteriales bacterium]OJW56799.1 MAG: hypothetical protein BGO55_27540 [Sphingobacteriales bacterium 50-39]